MLFTIMEILSYLIATALLSGYLGWLIHERVVIKDVQKRVSAEVNNLRSRCSKLMDELDSVRAELAASEQARAELEANAPALASSPAEAAEAQTEVEAETEAEADTQAQAQVEARPVEAETREGAPAGRAETAPPETAPPEAPSTQPAPPDSPPAKTTEPLAPEPPASQPPAPPPEPAHPNDDLKIIKGIGPVLERKLKGLGITSYGQMATLSPEEVTQLGRTLGIGDRINRDDWLGRARDAHRKAYGTEP
jgi:NADH-quinone oxidoreductase subunit E